MLKPINLNFLSKSLLFFLIALCCTPALAQQKKSTSVPKKLTNTILKDVLGWQDTRWGMSKAHIKKIFSQYLVSQDSKTSKDSKETKLDCKSLCYLINYKIANESFLVTFKFDDKTNGLNEVSLDTVKVKYPTPLFDELENLLILKYGSFRFKGDDTLGSLVDISRQWVFPTTIIELKQRYLKGNLTSNYTQIFFKPARLSDANKL